jgi:hypothetical protein
MDWMDIAMVGFLVIGVVVWLCKAYDDSTMKKENPEMWLRLKELEHEKQARKHESIKAGVGLGANIVKLFTKK